MSETTQVVPVIEEPSRGWRSILLNALIASGVALALLAVYYLPAMVRRPLLDAPEKQVAAVARTMLLSREYVLPAQNGEAYIQPPMPFWLAAVSSALFFGGTSGDTLAMARATQLPSAISAALAVFLAIVFGSAFFGRASGIMAGLMLGLAYLPAHFARSGYGDATLMLACCASVCGMAALLSERPGLFATLLAGFALGFGILTKGALPLALITLPVAAELFLRRKTIGWFHVLYVVLAFTIALVVASPWYILVARKNPGAMDAMVAETQEAVYTSAAASPSAPGDPAMRAGNVGVVRFFFRAAFGLLPWTPLLLIGFVIDLMPLKSANGAPRSERESARFFALYAGLGLLMFLLAPKKNELYFLPLFPALALAAGAMFGRFSSPGGIREERMGWGQLAIGLVGAAAFCCVPFFPAAINAIQTSGVAKLSYLAQFAASMGWFAVPLSLAFLIVSFICARLWTKGNGAAAIAMHAVLMFACLIYLTVRPSERARRDAFWHSLNDVRQKTDALEAQD